MSGLIRAGALALALVFAGIVLRGAADEPAATDLIAQYAAARLVAAGRGADILDQDAILAAEREAAPQRVRLLPFVQPPAVALLLAPLAGLPFPVAHRVAAAIDAALILAALAALTRGPGRVSTVALLVLAPPSVVAIAHGQTSPIVLALLAVAVRAAPGASGLALGLTLLRPQTAPLLLLAALADPARRPWAVAGALVVVAASAAVVGIDGLARYAATVVSASAWSVSGDVGLATGIGWSGLASWAGIGALGLVLPALSLALGAVATVRAAREDRLLVASAWSLVASPHALMHDALVAYPVVVALAARGARWDAASVLAWLAHALVAPLGVVWSLILAVRALGYPRPTR